MFGRNLFKGCMYLFTRIAVCVILLVQIRAPFAGAQSAEGASVSPNTIPKAVSSTCGQAPAAGPNFQLHLSKPTARWPRLNVASSACLPAGQVRFLETRPQFLEQVPVPGGPPTFCGIIYYGGVPMRVCTKG